MQRLWITEKSLLEYQEQEEHRRIRPEPACPCCGRIQGLNAHGYYQRWIADEQGKLWQVKIRRFRCRACRKTVSYLPLWAQPYRLLCNALIAAYGVGQGAAAGVQRWQDRLRQYWQRFVAWLPTLNVQIGCALGRPPPGETPQAAWRRLIEKGGGDLATATQKLVTTWKLTWFGRYQCHQHAL